MHESTGKVGTKLFFGQFGHEIFFIPTSISSILDVGDFFLETYFFKKLWDLNLNLAYFANNSIIL